MGNVVIWKIQLPEEATSVPFAAKVTRLGVPKRPAKFTIAVEMPE